MSEAACPDRARWIEYLHGSMDETCAKWLAGHLTSCPSCEQEMRELGEILETRLSATPIDSKAEDSFPPSESGFQLIEAMVQLLKKRDQPTLSEPVDEDQADDEPWQFNHYEVIRELGRGGMGTVYLAHDTRLHRKVALKFPRFPRVDEFEILDRMMQEARAAAGLRHANICPIYEVGEFEGQPFIAMAYIQGQTLREWVESGRSAREIAEMMSTLSRAIAYAHDNNIVHRDLKPGNVLIETATNFPILMDFGLAVDVGQEATRMTQDGFVLGTPAYMSPEQAAGLNSDVGPAADIYSLGVILFEMLAGEIPFKGSLVEVLAKVQHEDPPPLRKPTCRIHRDLETIVHKCMSKRIEDRYHSAGDLAIDLRRFSHGEPIVARRVGLLRRWAHKIRRRPLPALTVVAIAAAVAAVLYFVPLVDNAHRANALLGQINESLEQSDWSPAHVQQVEAQIAQLAPLSLDEAETSQARLTKRIDRAIRERLRQPRLSLDDVREIDDLLGLLDARSPQSATPLRATRDQRLREWQLEFELSPPFTQLPELFASRALTAENGEALALSASVDSSNSHLQVLSDFPSEGNAQLEAVFDGFWRPGQQVGLLLHADGGQLAPVTCLAYSPDNQYLASGNTSGMITIWQLDAHREVASVSAHSSAVEQLIFSPAGDLAATSSKNGDIAIWTTSDWKKRAGFSLADRPARASADILAPHVPLAFSCDGRFLAAGQKQGEPPCNVVVWDVGQGREVARLQGHTDNVTAVRFHPTDPQRLASASVDHTVRVWNVGTGEQQAVLAPAEDGNDDRIWNTLVSVAFVQDGAAVIAGELDEDLFQWELDTGKLVQDWDTEHVGRGRDGLNNVVLAKNGSLLAAVHKPQLDVWEFPQMRHLFTVPTGPCDFAPAGNRIAVGTSAGTVMLWDVARGRHEATLGGKSLAFVVRALEDQPSQDGNSLPNDDVPAAPQPLGGKVQASLFRNGILLRQEEFQLEQGPFQLHAQRANEILSLQVNDREPFVFRDVLPANRPAAGTYGVVLSPQAQLKHLVAYRQPLTPSGSPLEQGDDLYSIGQYSEAYAEYRRQAQISASELSGQADVRREAECKSALCLIALGRQEEAASTLQSLAKSNADDRWALVALCQTWLLRVRQAQFDEAASLSEGLFLRYNGDILAEYIPVETRRQIVDAYTPLFNPNYSALCGNSAYHLQTLYAICNWLPISLAEENALAIQLANALRDTPLEAHAKEVADTHQKFFQQQNLVDRLAESPNFESLRSWNMLLQFLGQNPACVRNVDELLFGTTTEQLEWALEQDQLPSSVHLSKARTFRPGLMPQGCLLLLERAQALARDGQWDETRRSIREFQRFATLLSTAYELHAMAWLLDGFALRELGKTSEADKAWQQSRFSQWQKAYGRESLKPQRLSTQERLLWVMTESLTGNALPSDARSNLLELLSVAGGEELFHAVEQHGELSVDDYPKVWQGRYGERLARRIALGELSAAGRLRASAMVLVAAGVARGCPAHGDSAVHSTIVNETIETMFGLFRTGRLTIRQLQQIMLAWNGNLAGSDWRDGDILATNPQLRSALAYLLGTRLLRVHQRPADAQLLFQLAVKLSPPKSDIRRLADEELERIESR